jgi:flagellar basal body-associated protein FliL
MACCVGSSVFLAARHTQVTEKPLSKDRNKKMAEPENAPEEKKKSGKSGLMMTVVIGALAVGGGVATPLVFASLKGDDANNSTQSAKKGGMDIPDATEKTTYIEFDEIVCNLNEARFNRYLKLNFSLQVAETQKVKIEALINEKKAVLKNWMIGHLADKSLEDIQGKFGHNRLRREIHDYFNLVLFDDGIERIQDILFKDLNIQ